ncbi:hypothetical protein HPP05_02995 [Corallococcus exiguus]|uniref:hypothetical protein n=1 Tax=Corallococcus exiguus TaxID=83462 RepID=UPI001494ACC9|nr:hypothetical protein [Corallococcus exiguus]NPC68714.1 hypothetical protein [Corallococcus exiguus]
MAGIPVNVPGTWAGLFSSEWGEDTHARELMKRFSPIALTKANTPVQYLRTLADVLASLIVLTGAEEARAAAAPLVPLCAAGVEQAGGFFDSVDPPRVALQVLSFVNAAEACGAAQGMVKASPAKTWLEALAKKVKKLDDVLLYRCGLVALCLGEPDLAAKLVGGGKLPETLTPGERFGFNVQGFVRYLATAMKVGAPSEAVRPAWESFVEGFPKIKAAEQVSWSDLLWAARAYFVGVEGRPVARVGESLHALVKPA